MIHICLCMNDKNGRYSKFAGTTMLSVFENTPPPTQITVHLLHDNTLTLDNRDKFSYIAARYGQCVKFYNVEELYADKIAEMVNLVPAVKNSRVSVGAFYKLIIPQVISPEIEKVIYLDADIIVNLDINELWEIALKDHPLGVVTESSNGIEGFSVCRDGVIKTEDYFNSGVLLMNLNLLRNEKETIQQGLIFKSNNPKYRQFDQLIFNYCFSTRALQLSIKFNQFVVSAQKKNEYNIGKKIYHYSDHKIKLNMNDPFNRLWMRYFSKTPWFNGEMIGRLYAGFEKIHIALKNSMINLSAIMSGKTRAFFVTPDDLEVIKEIFSIQSGEEIIFADNPQSLKKLIAIMKRSRGKKVFFIMLPQFPFNILIKEGFVFGKDFLNGMEFLSEENGVPLNSYSLVKDM